MPSDAPLTGLDHAVIAVADLDHAARRWERLGFTVSAQGEHPGRGTGNVCVMFPDNYLELIGLTERGAVAEFVSDGLKLRKAPSALAFATADAGLVRAALAPKIQGLSEVRHGTRTIKADGGDRSVRFDLVTLPPDPRWPRLFVCQHLDRDQVFAPEWLEHANGALGIAAIRLAVREASTLAAFGNVARRAFSGAKVAVDPTAVEVRWPGFSLRLFVGSTDNRAWWPTVVVEVEAIARAAAALDAGGIPFEQAGPRRLELHPDDADGVVLAFQERASR